MIYTWLETDGGPQCQEGHKRGYVIPAKGRYVYSYGYRGQTFKPQGAAITREEAIAKAEAGLDSL